jgi:UDP-N-acetylmuramoylalanine--D-glutamate ligase
LPESSVTIANQTDIADKATFTADPHTNLLIGEHYLDAIQDYDIVLKSPGVSLKNMTSQLDKSKISSQTDLFLQGFSSQSVGVTGTKGKSTSTTFLYHVLCAFGREAVIAGNMGIPFFDVVEDITPETTIILELSSHQLEFIHKSPHIAILLNLFEEHLDHYVDFSAYRQAKFNIARYQSSGDYFIYNGTDGLIAEMLNTNGINSFPVEFSLGGGLSTTSYVKDGYFYLFERGREKQVCKITDDFPLKGEHNILNTTVVIAALNCLGELPVNVERAIYSFKGLPHRLELIGELGGIRYYNDSISTIPQASIAAIEALKDVNTIILGGFDRGIDYRLLIDFLVSSDVEHIIFTGDAGRRMMELSGELKNKQLFFRDTYSEIVSLAKTCTRKGSICLLSPAAASYDSFRNFEHRGDVFRELVLSL